MFVGHTACLVCPVIDNCVMRLTLLCTDHLFLILVRHWGSSIMRPFKIVIVM